MNKTYCACLLLVTVLAAPTQAQPVASKSKPNWEAALAYSSMPKPNWNGGVTESTSGASSKSKPNWQDAVHDTSFDTGPETLPSRITGVAEAASASFDAPGSQPEPIVALDDVNNTTIPTSGSYKVTYGVASVCVVFFIITMTIM